MPNRTLTVTHLFVVLISGAAAAWSQSGAATSVNRDHPAIQYTGGFHDDPVAKLDRRLREGGGRLAFDDNLGYLPAVLRALGVPIESQILVFSKTSLQASLINPGNPRAIYFNDSAAVAWVRGGDALELAAQDPVRGTVFYTLPQNRSSPLFERETRCLSCHLTPSSLDVPGMAVRTVFPGAAGIAVTGLAGSKSDHRTPFDQRWGGWYITGKQGPLRHLANAVVASVRNAEGDPAAGLSNREPLPERFSTTSYPTPYSDVVAMAVFEHQMHMMNLITRIGWEARIALSGNPERTAEALAALLKRTVTEFVDYALFIDEAPFTAGIAGTSGFAERFSALGPFDAKGRSLRQFDLSRRLMRYPCSYMVYSDAFKAMPVQAREAIYDRMWDVLSGADPNPRYRRLSAADREAVIEILRSTISEAREYFSL
jgi:hypothetical protein